MQNIGPILLLQPALALAISLGALIVWWNRRGFRGMILLVSAGAYFLAIAAKYAIQIPTLGLTKADFGSTSVGLGLYFGLQTVFLEVGFAYVLVRYAAKRRGLKAPDAVPYGLALSFWENGVLLGVFSMLNLSVVSASRERSKRSGFNLLSTRRS